MKLALVWFRQDLRLSDNPAFDAAVRSGAPVVPLFILDDETPGDWRPGGASRWWLHFSLAALKDDLARLGARLILHRGDARRVLFDVVREVGAGAVYWNRCYEPFATKRDEEIKEALKAQGTEVNSFNGSLLIEPWDVTSKSGKPFRVFAPFWKAVSSNLKAVPPLPAPDNVPSQQGAAPHSESLEDWHLLPQTPDWAGGLRENWSPGEVGAKKMLKSFLSGAFGQYAEARDHPSQERTSRLSPHLHWGEISPRQIWHALRNADPNAEHVSKFQSEVGWREFSHHLLWQFPELPERNLRQEFDDFPWTENEAHLTAWQKGETGIPLVDAGMRELWHTGWMHNRARMVTASYLVKHLLQPWQAGERWFWDTLVDADLANNAANWQWVAGCGTDAAPYFRIFNPVVQGKKFDPDGVYIKYWVPELRDVPAKSVHAPWEMTSPPSTYPTPIVDLAKGRARALAAFETIKNA